MTKQHCVRLRLLQPRLKSVSEFLPGFIQTISSYGLAGQTKFSLQTVNCRGLAVKASHSQSLGFPLAKGCSSFSRLHSNEPFYWVNCRSFKSSAEAKPMIENFDDIQRQIRTWRQDGEKLSEVQAVLEALYKLGPLPVWINPHHMVPFFSRQISNFKLHDAVLLYGWACKVQVNHQSFMEEIVKRLRNQGLEELDKKSLVLAICATGQLKSINTSSMTPDSGSYPMESSVMSSETEFIGKVAHELVKPARLPTLTPQDLTNTVFGLGWLGYQERTVIDPLVNQLSEKDRLSGLSEQELVKGVQGLSLLGLQEHSLLVAMVTEALTSHRIINFTCKDITTLLQSMTSLKLDLGSFDGDLKLLMDEIVRTQRLPNFENHQLSSVLHSVSQLEAKSCKVDQEITRTLLEELLRSSRRKGLDNKDLSLTLNALGTSGFYDDTTAEILLNEVGRADRLSTYSAEDLANIIHGLGEMQVKEGILLEKLVHQLAQPQVLKEVNDNQIYSVMMALMKLNFQYSELISPLLERTLKSGGGIESMDLNQLSKYACFLGKAGPGLNSDLEKLLARALSQPLTGVSNDSLVVLLDALGEAGQAAAKLVPSVVDELSRMERLQELTPEDVASVMFALGRTRAADPRVVDKLLWELTKEGVLPNLSNSTLSKVMYGLGQLRHVPSEGVLVLLEAEFKREDRTSAYTFQDLANIIHSLGLLRLENRERIASAADTLATMAVSSDKLGQSSDVELACFLYGLCHLRYKNPQVLEPLMNMLVTGDRLAHFPNKDICNMIYAVGQMGYNAREHVQPLVEEAKHVDRLQRYSAVQVATLIYSLGKIRYSDQHTVKAFVSEVLRPNRLGALKSQDLVSVLHGLVYTKLSTGNAISQVLGEVGRLERRTDFIGSEVLTITKCLCNLRKNAPSRQVESLLEVFLYEMCRAERLSEFDARQLSQVAITLADAKNRDAGLVLQILRELTKTSVAKNLSLDDLAKLVWSIGPTGQVNKDDRPSMVVYTRALIHMAADQAFGFADMSSGHLAEMLIGMGCMGLRDYKIIDSLGDEIVQEHRLEYYRPWHLCKIFRALGQLQSQNTYVLKILSKEISRPKNVEKMQPEQWSELMTAIVLLGQFQDKNLFKAVVSQVRVGNRDPVIRMEGVRTASHK